MKRGEAGRQPPGPREGGPTAFLCAGGGNVGRESPVGKGNLLIPASAEGEGEKKGKGGRREAGRKPPGPRQGEVPAMAMRVFPWQGLSRFACRQR
eukprot:8734791-Heterocapsa_arctica.AAC.1